MKVVTAVQNGNNDQLTIKSLESKKIWTEFGDRNKKISPF